MKVRGNAKVGLEREVKQLMVCAVNTRDVVGSRGKQRQVEAVLESGRRRGRWRGFDVLGRECRWREKKPQGDGAKQGGVDGLEAQWYGDISEVKK